MSKFNGQYSKAIIVVMCFYINMADEEQFF